MEIALDPRTDVVRPRQAPAPHAAPVLEADWARDAETVRQAQRLRHRVFAREMGAQLSPPPGTPPGLDVDHFDAFCEHLVVRTVPRHGAPARVVGTYRALTPAGADLAGSLYSESEFDLTPLAGMRARMVELGRSCIDPTFRDGSVILMLWRGLAELMQRNGLRWMVGCASVPMLDGGHAAASLWHQLSKQHLADPALRVQPLLPLPVEHLRCDLPVEVPPLIKGYLRCGAQLLGPPAWDPAFGTADLPILLDLEALSPGYRKRFLGI